MALRVVVKVFDLRSGEEEISRAISLNTPKGKDWLSRVMTWAANQGKGVQLFNVKDEAIAKGNS